MQRAKHADRRKETRTRLELGAAVEAAGAAHLSRAEIMAALTAHVEGRESSGGLDEAQTPPADAGTHHQEPAP